MADEKKGEKPASDVKKGVGLGFGACIGAIALVIVLIILGSVLSSNKSSTKSSNTSPGANQSKEAEKPKGKVEVKSDSVKDEGFGYKSIVGEVENKTGGDVSNIKTTATLYDKDGKVVDTQADYNFDVIKDGATTPFKIMIIKGKFDHYKLDVTWD